MGDFVRPARIRLTLADGQYIDIRQELNHGETEDMWAKWSPYVEPGNAAHLDRREVRRSKVLAYLLAWSLTDGDIPGTGAPVPMSPDLPESERSDILRNLTQRRFNEIHDAIERHELAMTTVREEQKKTATGSPDAPRTSDLPSAVDGILTGSVS
jgi:hypothetical protein